jgi:ribonuclease P protein subunit RPR2
MRDRNKHRRRIKNHLKKNINRLITSSFQLDKNEFMFAKNYIKIAKNMSSKTKIKIPKIYKRFICRRCSIPLIPGRTLRVRIKVRRQKHMVYTCLECGLTRRYIIRRSDNEKGK